LRYLRFIKTEAADFESYRGCTTADELTDFLKARGFKLTHKEVFAEHKNGGKYYELLFEKRGFIDTIDLPSSVLSLD
jgi:hypothetical protein